MPLKFVVHLEEVNSVLDSEVPCVFRDLLLAESCYLLILEKRCKFESLPQVGERKLGLDDAFRHFTIVKLLILHPFKDLQVLDKHVGDLLW